ncbi:ribonuclease H-like domain-containing protein [Tanacetum coccineum]
MTHPYSNRRFVPQTVLAKSDKINTAGASVNTVVRPVNTVGSKTTMNHPRPISNTYKNGYSQVTRPFNRYSEYKNSIFNKKVNTVRVKDTTTRDRAVVSENKGKGVNAVKASACWVWKPKTIGNPQQKEYKEKEFIDSGCSRHMTGNKCYLTEVLRENSVLLGLLSRIVFANKEEYNTNRGSARTMVLVIKPHNKTPYKLIRGRTPLIDFMKPFGCLVTILNTRDHLGKFDGKADEGFFVGYSVVSKAMRIFDVDSLTISMNYVPVVAGNQTNGIAGTRDNIVTCQAEKKTEPEQEYILIPICITDPLISQDPKVSEEDAEEKPTEMDESGASDKDGKDE